MAKKVKKTTTEKKTTKKAAAKKTTAKKATVKKSTKKTVKKTVTKKAVSKKATKKITKSYSKKVSQKAKKSSLSTKDLEYFRQLLMEKQKEIFGDVNAMEAEALRKSRLEAAGDLSSMPIHMADMGTDNFEQEFSLGLMDSERKILHDIIKALDKIDLGTYGICEGTGKQIPKARLEASPWAKYCIEYASMLEKGLVLEGEYIGDDEDDEPYDDDSLDDNDLDDGDKDEEDEEDEDDIIEDDDIFDIFDEDEDDKY